ncbi:MAG: cytochrome C oxidase subunit IV family protein [Planctomycetota bacterium]|jgi:cytochrome c oxidase subunit 4|nr:cytochrome C oxidase subunit IV family protein [Planctomycetota bacterium]MDG2143879.1 cytochrome C oxidase subunit IV family protein [Planctomycetota bacterium]
MHHSEEKPGYDLGHPASMKMLWSIFGALLVLTVLTVAVAQFNLGAIDFSIAMIIATVKATLVAVYFMHLNHDKGVNRLLFIGAILFAGLFLAIALGDVSEYHHEIEQHRIDNPDYMKKVG